MAIAWPRRYKYKRSFDAVSKYTSGYSAQHISKSLTHHASCENPGFNTDPKETRMDNDIKELRLNQTAQALILQILLNGHINMHEEPDTYREQLFEAVSGVGKQMLESVGQEDDVTSFNQTIGLLFSR
ncbi:hypothetical protein WM40_24495 [Robbsia andropogonis]|uniref:Uncharacterized protein n=2 Tax=Robbsia andropogonis TaxID=28092 RepID=A0A0F5JV68_9BURK|nr:hypothetical protein WM40_24495 [Robbsia andropogonis]